MLLRKLEQFFDSEISGGIVLMVAAVAAMIVANSSLHPYYDGALSSYFTVQLGENGLSKPLILWINDGLMAVFFLLVGLELKHELMEGKLKNPRDVVLPGMAAVGGMLMPALIYFALNISSPETHSGWAIPAATDIAFALGILALVGDRVPSSLKVFLLTLAILDDLGAILIIAFFYTAELHLDYLFLALIPLAIMFYLNRSGIHRIAPIILLGAVLWVLVLKSGVHATLAGVITAFFIPIKDKWGKSPLHSLEHALSPYVFFLIVPIFAFANAGVVLSGVTLADVFSPLPLGIALGLILGKQIGVFGMTWALVKLGIARKPFGATWLHIYGVAALAGIGFTMSLFIGGLSFEDAFYMNEVRIGVLSGSVISAIIGFTVLRLAPSEEDNKEDKVEDAEITAAEVQEPAQ
ncbi:Na+/H+ antiporter NhaA [Celeribacter halophilus]|jgi:NhaA family Na+:H+ antiporter|uniref:Na+/H+ antiporter NhaA n=1 Tax=Celeribacter halophilus TaxID=576117 RepID=UPI001C0A543A|nr:Na+/H+ antiporter NhaA [Celeribacter halophilus]MBU2891152.1 Na+/H+ antiporter NhaA [Celeribacter halophilus]MDO6510961.1 Na+/H+ antiporter NhaA [Celeribacter halophilus]